MTAQEKRERNVLKRSERTIERTYKEYANLEMAQRHLSYESAEYHIISNAMGHLIGARRELEIVGKYRIL